MIKPISILISYKFIDGDLYYWGQARNSKDKLAGLYEFPGGKVESGETPFEACLREVEEEVGVKVSSAELFSHFEFSDGLLIYVYMREDRDDKFSSQGYQKADMYLDGTLDILPNNHKILADLSQYFQSFRAL